MDLNPEKFSYIVQIFRLYSYDAKVALVWIWMKYVTDSRSTCHPCTGEPWTPRRGPWPVLGGEQLQAADGRAAAVLMQDDLLCYSWAYIPY